MQGRNLIGWYDFSSYNHKFGPALFNANITFRSTWIERIVMDKRLELEEQKQIE